MREPNPSSEEKISQLTHVSLGALKGEFSAKVDLRSAGLHWIHEVELNPKMDLRSDGLQRNPEDEISRKMQKKSFQNGILKFVTAITMAERVQ